MNSVEQIQRYRFLFLKQVYKTSNANQNVVIDFTDVCEKIGLHLEDQAVPIIQYLGAEDLIDNTSRDYTHGHITHHGIVAYEKAITHPYQETDNFLSLDKLGLGEGDDNSIDEINESDINHLKEIINELKDTVDHYDLDEHTKKDLYGEIETIESQLKVRKPKPSIIHPSLHSITEILKDASTSVATKDLNHKIMEFFGRLGEFF